MGRQGKRKGEAGFWIDTIKMSTPHRYLPPVISSSYNDVSSSHMLMRKEEEEVMMMDEVVRTYLEDDHGLVAMRVPLEKGALYIDHDAIKRYHMTYQHHKK